jgi:thioredoxin reductase
MRKSRKKSTSISESIFDVAIIGAGFAGLSAALVLGRYLLTTIVFDAGKTRNHRTEHVHSYLGLENISPSKLIARARRDVLSHDSVNIIKQQVTAIKHNKDHFIIATSQEHAPVKAKYIIIATGVLDIKPDINNFNKIDGRGAWHCPHCDGLESAGKSLIILANGKVESSVGAISYAKEFLGWTNDIRVFIQDNCPIDQEQRNEAKRLSIEIIENDPVVEVLKASNRLSVKIKLLSKSGNVYHSDVVFYHLGYKVQNSLAKQLGCELEEEFIKVDKRQQTTVPQVFAAGDIDTDRHFVVFATASGALAAISIYEETLKKALET